MWSRQAASPAAGQEQPCCPGLPVRPRRRSSENLIGNNGTVSEPSVQNALAAHYASLWEEAAPLVLTGGAKIDPWLSRRAGDAVPEEARSLSRVMELNQHDLSDIRDQEIKRRVADF